MIKQNLPKDFIPMVATQEKKEEELLSRENVTGVALGHKIKNNKDTGEPSLVVFVTQKLDEDLLSKVGRIPKAIDGVKTDVIETGPIFAGQLAAEPETVKTNGTVYGPKVGLDFDTETEYAVLEAEQAALPIPRPRRRPEVEAPPTLRQRVRPVMGGFSIGHYKSIAGTVATACYDWSAFPGIPPRYYLLSNNHVLANSNNARLGDPILQPCPYDGGVYPRDMIGRLTRYVPIRFRANGAAPRNYVDAALAEVPFHLVDREIYWLGRVKRLWTQAKINETVQKTGRTTNFSTGRVIALNATVDVGYGNGRMARFCRQIVTSPMGAPGDSGSLITNLTEEAVGLLFAGSTTVSIANDIRFVQQLLRIRLCED